MSPGLLNPFRLGGGEAYAAAVLADNPMAYYRFGEPAGVPAQDSSGNGRHAAGRSTNSASVAGLLTGSANGAFDFPGTGGTASNNDVQIAASNFFGMTAVTLECIILPDNVTGAKAILNRYYFGGGAGTWQGFALYMSNATLIARAPVNASSTVRIATTGNVLAAGVKSHIAMSYDLNTLRVFHNGIQVQTAGPYADTSLNDGTYALQISSQPTSNVGQYGGVIDEVAVYPHAVAQARLAAHAALV